MSIIARSPSVASMKAVDRLHQIFCIPGLIQVAPKIYVVDIPKSGSSFLKSALIASGNCSLSLSPVLPHAAVFKRPLRGRSLNHIKMYAFVRDPIDRFCSVVREKLLSSTLHRRGWCPYALSLGRRMYNISTVDAMISQFTTSRFSILDKHILPQSCFWSNYFGLPGFQLLPSSSIGDFLVSSGIDPIFFPDSSVSLVTDKSVFSRADLTESSLDALSYFYRSDLLSLRML